MTKKTKKQIENKLQNSKQNKSRKITSNDEFNNETNKLFIEEISNNSEFYKEIIEISSDEESSSSSSSGYNNSSSSSSSSSNNISNNCKGTTLLGEPCKYTTACRFHITENNNNNSSSNDNNNSSHNNNHNSSNNNNSSRSNRSNNNCRGTTSYGKPCKNTINCRFHRKDNNIEITNEEMSINLEILDNLNLNINDIQNKNIQWTEIEEENKAIYLAYCSIYEFTEDQISVYFNVPKVFLGVFKRKYSKKYNQYIKHFMNTLKLPTKNNIKGTKYQCSVCEKEYIYNKYTKYVRESNYIWFLNIFPEKKGKIIINTKVCDNCYNKALKSKDKKQEIQKDILLTQEYDNFDNYLEGLKNYFYKPLDESIGVAERIHLLLSSENREFTENEILNNLGVSYSMNNLLESPFITTTTINNKVYYKYNNNNMLYIPNITLEHTNTLEQLKKEYSPAESKFNYNNFTNFHELKKNIENNIKKWTGYAVKNSKVENKENNIKFKYCKEILNDFIIECYKKIFYQEAPFIDKMTDANKVCYFIINNYKMNLKIDLPRIYASIKKAINPNFIITEHLFIMLNDLIHSLKYSKKNYSIYFKNDLCGYFEILRYHNYSGKIKNKEVATEKEKNQNFIIENNRAILKLDCQIGDTYIGDHHCIEELEDNLNNKLIFYTNNNIKDSKNYIIQMDHIPYAINDLNEKSGFCVSYCNHNINYLLVNFSMTDDRLLNKILNENNVKIKSKFEANNVKYQQLKNNIDTTLLNEWIDNIKNKVQELIENIKTQINRKHNEEELKYLFNQSININIKGIALRYLTDKEYQGLDWDHSHTNSFKIFNFILRYLNLSTVSVNSKEEMKLVYDSIKKEHSPNAKLLKYLLHAHIPHYGRGFIDNKINLATAHYERLLLLGWDENKIRNEITNMLIGDPIVDCNGNLIVYYL